MPDVMLPAAFIHQSFRYVLGRRTYAVSIWCDWCVANWNNIPTGEAAIIERELEEAYVFDDRDRRENRDVKYLGDDCDRLSWDRVRACYRKQRKCIDGATKT